MNKEAINPEPEKEKIENPTLKDFISTPEQIDFSAILPERVKKFEEAAKKIKNIEKNQTLIEKKLVEFGHIDKPKDTETNKIDAHVDSINISEYEISDEELELLDDADKILSEITDHSFMLPDNFQSERKELIENIKNLKESPMRGYLSNLAYTLIVL